MATAKKLDIFTLKDAFNLSNEEILEEAQASAQRRAEVMNWQDISIKQGDLTVVDGDVKKYSFEIWGLGQASPEMDSVVSDEPNKVTPNVSAAKSPEL